jgi:GNAT superfamily N-acetyltransferase
MQSSPTDLARQVDHAQSILDTPAAMQARRLERALAVSCRSLAASMARLDPGSRAAVLETPAGVAIFAGSGSPLTQVLAAGLSGPVSPADLERLEAHLTMGKTGPAQFELCPFADPTLPALLAERSYRVHEWQLAWTRLVPRDPMAPPPPGLEVRRVRPGEEDAQVRTVLSAFLESEEVPEDAIAMLRPGAFAEGHELYLALVDGQPVGGATLSFADGVALVNGSGVRPAFRGRGVQGALIRARLDRARELSCDVACSSTLPGTPSRRNMERHGFHVAYPKLVMLRDR